MAHQCVALDNVQRATALITANALATAAARLTATALAADDVQHHGQAARRFRERNTAASVVVDVAVATLPASVLVPPTPLRRVVAAAANATADPLHTHQHVVAKVEIEVNVKAVSSVSVAKLRLGSLTRVSTSTN
jgi:hypothetical protein